MSEAETSRNENKPNLTQEPNALTQEEINNLRKESIEALIYFRKTIQEAEAKPQPLSSESL